jgi:hypothetical protein
MCPDTPKTGGGASRGEGTNGLRDAAGLGRESGGEVEGGGGREALRDGTGLCQAGQYPKRTSTSKSGDGSIRSPKSHEMIDENPKPSAMAPRLPECTPTPRVPPRESPQVDPQEDSPTENLHSIYLFFVKRVNLKPC